MRDLLIAVDLTHVARGQGQFIGYDSLAAHVGESKQGGFVFPLAI